MAFSTTPGSFLDPGRSIDWIFAPGTHSGRPTPGPSLGLGFRPLPSFDHLGFCLAQRRIQTVKSSKELLSI
jgi:hypothetical protein